MLTKNCVVSIRNLSKIYKLYKNPKDRLKEALSIKKNVYHKTFFALKDINLEIKKGEIIGIIGKNGSGKSTLLKILSNVLTQSSGNFDIKGKISSLLELGSGFNPELTGLENVYFYSTILGYSESKVNEKLPEILNFADIGEYIYQPLKTYSSGMKARLAFSVAINVDPDILILDEILAVGDELFRRKCYARMESFFKGQKTILFVSHSISDINQFCTRVIMLDKGEFILEGKPKLVTEQYQRYLFSTPALSSKIRNEIIELNKYNKLNINDSKTYDDNSKEINNTILDTKKNINENDFSNLVNNVEIKESLIPDFVPKSTIEYKNYDVKISDINITTLKGEYINVLISGNKYIYSYNVKFNININNVVFGMMIKDEKGQKVSGSSTSFFNKVINNISKGSIFNIRWEFRCNLLPGNYFTNVGVSAITESDRIRLNRIVDALVFKVYQTPNNPYQGLVYIEQIPSITILK